MNKKLTDLHFGDSKHPAYSPDLAHSDYDLLLNFKKHLKGRKLVSFEEATLVVELMGAYVE
jgi:hypothetical protein